MLNNSPLAVDFIFNHCFQELCGKVTYTEVSWGSEVVNTLLLIFNLFPRNSIKQQSTWEGHYKSMEIIVISLCHLC